MASNTMTLLLREFKDAEGKRHIEIYGEALVMPYVRQTRFGRFGNKPHAVRARSYLDNQARIRDAVKGEIKARGIKPFAKTKIGFQCSFWLCPKRVQGPTRATVKDNPARVDLGNLEKAIEDALRDCVYDNDHNIWARGVGAKHVGEQDKFSVHIWEL